MRPEVLARILGRVTQFVGLSLLVPALVGLHYAEAVWLHYAATSALAIAMGMGSEWWARRRLNGREGLTRKEGFLAVCGSWASLVFFGALPFWLSGSIPSFTDAFFESMSGYTTTGATILSDIESLARAHLYQRSLAHWVGGMGIIVLSVAVLPELAVGGMQVFSAESSGIGTDKLSPRIVTTSRRLWQVYAGMTGCMIVLLLMGGMNLFDATTHAFGTLATGGFSPRSASVGAYDSVYIETVITIFMLASAMSFSLHYRLFVRRQPTPMLRSTEVRLFLAIFALFTLAITANLMAHGTYPDYGPAFRAASFQTASIMSTTGFGTADFNAWPDFSRYLLVLLMFLGGCAGSTAGGVKVVRLLVVTKHAGVELKKLIYPGLVHPVTLRRRAVSPAVIQGILGFFLLYIITTVTATMLVLATGVPLLTGATAVFSAMNSIGPGLDAVGPAAHFGHLPAACKWILSACMLVGRLEIYTIFVLFTPEFWRR